MLYRRLTLSEFLSNVRIESTSYIKYYENAQAKYKRLCELQQPEAERFGKCEISSILTSVDGELILTIFP